MTTHSVVTSERLTNAASRILGYLISAQGNEKSGSTVEDIIAATGLGRNTVYTYLRGGLPGVVESQYYTLKGAKQYYVTPQTLREAGSKVDEVLPHNIFNLDEIRSCPPEIKAGIESTLNKEPASRERINALMEAMVQADRLENYLVGGAVIMLLARELLKGEK